MILGFRPVVFAAWVLGVAACGAPDDVGSARVDPSARTMESTSAPRSGAVASDSQATAGQHARAADSAGGASPKGVRGSGVRPRRVLVNGIDLTGIGYDVGNPLAPIVLVNFSDFGCPYCASFARSTYPALDTQFVQTGKVYFKYVPFVMGMFPNGAEAARASECAADQGEFWPMHDRLYSAQSEWKSSRSPAPLFLRYASALGLEQSRFSACYTDRRTDARTDRANDRAARLGIRATPTFFVNDQQIEGALPLEVFRTVLSGAAP